jgi:hypothetical protein
MEYAGFSIIECRQPRGIALKMRGHKLRSGVYWQRVLKKKA